MKEKTVADFKTKESIASAIEHNLQSGGDITSVITPNMIDHASTRQCLLILHERLSVLLGDKTPEVKKQFESLLDILLKFGSLQGSSSDITKQVIKIMWNDTTLYKGPRQLLDFLEQSPSVSDDLKKQIYAISYLAFTQLQSMIPSIGFGKQKTELVEQNKRTITCFNSLITQQKLLPQDSKLQEEKKVETLANIAPNKEIPELNNLKVTLNKLKVTRHELLYPSGLKQSINTKLEIFGHFKQSTVNKVALKAEYDALFFAANYIDIRDKKIPVKNDTKLHRLLNDVLTIITPKSTTRDALRIQTGHRAQDFARISKINEFMDRHGISRDVQPVVTPNTR
ncbi:MAG: hypothetical protein H0U75_01505 [Legionella sp.]|nr:hypothetical protein [Legionella sp.]